MQVKHGDFFVSSADVDNCVAPHPAQTNTQNAATIVGELLTYLTIADFSMREELVLKTAVLAEK